MATRAELDATLVMEIEGIRASAANGLSIREIAEEVGMLPKAVRWRCKKYGIEYRRLVNGERSEGVYRGCKCHGGSVAMGHKFTWDLSCGCGYTWHEQQRKPTKCSGDYCDRGHLRREHWFRSAETKKSYCRECVREYRKAQREAARLAREESHDGG